MRSLNDESIVYGDIVEVINPPPPGRPVDPDDDTKPRPGDEPIDWDDDPERSDEPDDKIIEDLLKRGKNGQGPGDSDAQRGPLTERQLRKLRDELEKVLDEPVDDAEDLESESTETGTSDITDEDFARTGKDSISTPKVNIPDSLINEFNKLKVKAATPDIDWYAKIRTLIKKASGSRSVTDDNIPSRRMAATWGDEDDVSEYKSIMVAYDISDSMNYQDSLHSFQILKDVFKNKHFRNCKVYIVHYHHLLAYSAVLGKYSESRFLSESQKGFLQPRGATEYYTSVWPWAKQNVQLSRLDFVLHFTDGGLYYPKDVKDPNFKKWVNKTITVFVGGGAGNPTGTTLYRGFPQEAKDLSIRGAKRSDIK